MDISYLFNLEILKQLQQELYKSICIEPPLVTHLIQAEGLCLIMNCLSFLSEEEDFSNPFHDILTFFLSEKVQNNEIEALREFGNYINSGFESILHQAQHAITEAHTELQAQQITQGACNLNLDS